MVKKYSIFWKLPFGWVKWIFEKPSFFEKFLTKINHSKIQKFKKYVKKIFWRAIQKWSWKFFSLHFWIPNFKVKFQQISKNDNEKVLNSFLNSVHQKFCTFRVLGVLEGLRARTKYMFEDCLEVCTSSSLFVVVHFQTF